MRYVLTKRTDSCLLCGQAGVGSGSGWYWCVVCGVLPSCSNPPVWWDRLNTSHDFTAASRRLHSFTKTARDFTKTQKLHVDFTGFTPRLQHSLAVAEMSK